MRQASDQKLKESCLKFAFALGKENLQHFLHELTGCFSILRIQLPHHPNKPLGNLLASLIISEKEERFIVVAYLIQSFSSNGAVVEKAVKQLLHFLRFLQKDFFCEVVKEWGEVLGLFNKEQ